MQEKKYQIVPSVVEDYFVESFNNQPCYMTLPLITKDGFDMISKNMVDVWVTNYFFDKKVFKFEGLMKSPQSPTLLYFAKSEDETTYKIVFLYDKSQEDAIIFMMNSLIKYQILNNESFNNTRTE